MATKFYNLSTDNTLGGNSPSDNIVASEKAIKNYIDNQGFITGIGSSDVTTALGYTPSSISLSNTDDTGTSTGAGWSMPSDTYKDLTLGANNASYTAVANGYVEVQFRKNDHNYSSASIWTSNLATRGQCDTGSGDELAVYLPVKKGQIFNVGWIGSLTNTKFRFTYAVGSESEGS